jgi:hypothetical protein
VVTESVLADRGVAVDALVTERLLMFGEALVKREQIRRSYPSAALATE